MNWEGRSSEMGCSLMRRAVTQLRTPPVQCPGRLRVCRREAQKMCGPSSDEHTREGQDRVALLQFVIPHYTAIGTDACIGFASGYGSTHCNHGSFCLPPT